MKYDKEEVMQKLWNEIMVFSLGDIQTGDKKKLVELLSTALDAAYKAGREEMYLAGGKACKKAYQNHKEDHLCRFNDGEQNCNCYLSGMNEIIVALEVLK